jgi:nucleoside-diphosphate-sugar epimerase
VLAGAFVERGHEVHGFDSGLFVRHRTGPLPRIASQTNADLRDRALVRAAVAKCDVVIQLAAMSNDPLGELDPALTRSVNLDATLDLIEASRGRGLVLYSSASVYGASAKACAEGDPTDPLTLYSELKLAAEHAALEHPGALVLRNGTVHGPAPILRGDLLLNAMVASAVTSEEIVLMTTPATMRPVIDVRDLAALTVGLVERQAGGLYNLAATNVSVGDAARIVARATGARIVERHDAADPRDYAMDTAKLSALAGSWWTPRPLEESVRDLVAHYRATGLTAADVATRRYHRIVQFRGATVPAAAAR